MEQETYTLTFTKKNGCIVGLKVDRDLTVGITSMANFVPGHLAEYIYALMLLNTANREEYNKAIKLTELMPEDLKLHNVQIMDLDHFGYENEQKLFDICEAAFLNLTNRKHGENT